MFLGDYSTGDTIDFLFNSISSGAPTALLSGGIEVYKTTSTTPTTVGVTLTSTFASKTGVNQVQVIMTDSFYASGNKYHVQLSTGTIDGTSVYPREVVKRALAVNAAAIILAHNRCFNQNLLFLMGVSPLNCF